MTPEDFDTTLEADRGTTEPAMIVDVEGFEGPLDLLLALARTQKVDLAKISILALADQYLQFIEAARQLRLELAADYLVMAAWLAYLKSRLLLPESDPEEGPSAEDMALALAYRLRRLEAIRDVATQLMERPRLFRDVFPRGEPEPIDEIKQPEWTATLYDLLSAYATQRAKSALSHVRFKKRTVWSLAEARDALERLIGMSSDWSRIDAFLISFVVEPALAATVMASSFASALELVREGVAEIHQKEFVRADLHAQAGRCERKCFDAMTRKKKRKGKNSMPSAAKKLVIVRNNDASAGKAADAPAAQARPEELRLLEALLFAAGQPLDEATLSRRLPNGVDVKEALAALKAEYATRGVNLVRVGKKWMFRTADDLSWLLTKETVETRKLSRAAIETLAIIAYHQPVDARRDRGNPRRGGGGRHARRAAATRTGSGRAAGARRRGGRSPTAPPSSSSPISGWSRWAICPASTSSKAPACSEGNLPPGFAVPMPSDDSTLRDDEDPLEPGDLDLGLAPPSSAQRIAASFLLILRSPALNSMRPSECGGVVNAAFVYHHGTTCENGRLLRHYGCITKDVSPCFCRLRSLVSGSKHGRGANEAAAAEDSSQWVH